jgi:hypothetical protein
MSEDQKKTDGAIAGLERPKGVGGPPPRRHAPQAGTEPAPSAAPSATAPSSDSATRQNAAPVARSKRTSTARRPRSYEQVNESSTHPSSLSLPVGVVERARSYVRAHPEKTNADVVIDALIDKSDELAELVEPLKVKEYTVGLFRRKAPQEVKNHSALPVRMSPDNWAAIDKLVEQAKADNRSQLCFAALDAFLPELPGNEESGG